MDDTTLLSWIEKGQNVAALLVAIGVAAEFLLGYMAGPARKRLDQAKETEITSLTREAAALTRDSAALRKEAEDERLKRVKIEQELTAQGPRAPVIEKAAPELIKELTPFAGQKMDFFIWRQNSSVYDRDALDTWGAIANILGNDGAKWIIGHGGFRFFDTHLSTQGVTAKALPPSANKLFAPVNPDFMLPVLARGLMNKDDPQALVAQDATLITVLIGERPQKSGITKSNAHK